MGKHTCFTSSDPINLRDDKQSRCQQHMEINSGRFARMSCASHPTTVESTNK